MKKLMIVAAVAAIAGAAEAVVGYNQLYQATFNLKTTVGKSGKATINLGRNPGTGKFWYEDGLLNTWLDNAKPVGEMIKDTAEAKKFFTYKKVKGSNVPVPTADGLAAATLNDKLVTLSTTYNKKSDNAWCVTFKNDVCYRVAGTIKITGWFVDDECFRNLGYCTQVDAFGAGSVDECKSAELYGEVAGMFGVDLYTTAAGAASGAGEYAKVLDNLKVDRTINVLHVAGQGAFGKVYDPFEQKATEPGVTSISGNAVGLATDGVCTSCCLPDTPVVPVNCCSYGAPGTAVFGTFTVKYNLAQTKKELY